MTKQPAQPKRSWELAIRLFHWVLVATFAGSWITSELGTDYRDLHMQFGYVLLGLLIFRLIWGVVGGEYARFRRFPIAPKAIWHYARTLFRRDDSEPVQGHNPLGAMMVIVMLAMLAVQVTSGLFTTDDIFYDGPYVAMVSSDVVDTMSSLHHDNFDWLKWLVVLHVCAIGFYWLAKRVNLLRPMVHAPLPANSPSTMRIFLLALISAAVATTIVYIPAF
ncbi:MAG: cytochrome b561 [Lysobacteraceae bacterium]|nr:MAG: cytochrome b561 [Xanthomonadaceae bacterium]